VAALICDVGSSPDSRHGLGQNDRSPASHLTLFHHSLVLLVQILDPIFKLAVGVLWKTCGDHVDATGRDILAALIWPISHYLADAKPVG
jgi:hypothetical protein